MANVLIWKDEESIKKGIEALDNLIPYMQSVYDAFSAIKIDLTEADIISLFKQQRTATFASPFVLEKYVKEKLLEGMSVVELGGVIVLNKQKLGELMELPDLTNLKEVLSDANVSRNFTMHYSAIHMNDKILSELIRLEKGKFYKERDANKVIVEMFTHNTNTSTGDDITKRLHGVCNALNEWMPYACQFLGEGFISNNSGDGKLLAGVMVLNGKCIPSVEFVRAHEKY